MTEAIMTEAIMIEEISQETDNNQATIDKILSHKERRTTLDFSLVI